jgi:hypothetical protein
LAGRLGARRPGRRHSSDDTLPTVADRLVDWPMASVPPPFQSSAEAAAEPNAAKAASVVTAKSLVEACMVVSSISNRNRSRPVGGIASG